MPNANQLMRIISEMVFVLVGALLVLFALTNRYLFDPRRPGWLILAGVLVAWGLREWWRARKTAVRTERTALRIGGLSLVIVGAIMLSLAWLPLGVIGLLLGTAGGVFVLRGLILAGITVLSR